MHTEKASKARSSQVLPSRNGEPISEQSGSSLNTKSGKQLAKMIRATGDRAFSGQSMRVVKRPRITPCACKFTGNGCRSHSVPATVKRQRGKQRTFTLIFLRSE